jgi:peptidoglycan hydrolase-like protein with peptidoglycan-binding domain
MTETLINLRGLNLTSFRFRRRLVEVAREIDTDRDYLATTIKFESNFLPGARNRYSGAIGLIQFLPVTAIALGTTPEALAQMSDVDQLDYVEKYFWPYVGRLKSLSDTYFAVFYPAAIGKALDHVLFRKGQKAYEQNSGFDRQKAGQITCGDVVHAVSSLYYGSIQKERLMVDDAGDTDPIPPAPAHPILRIGSTGPAVTAWQMLVGVVADGQFGPLTAEATKTWQRARGLEPDGVVGPKTWARAPDIADLGDLGDAS